MSPQRASVRDRLRVRPGAVTLAGYDPRATPLAPGDKRHTLARLKNDAGTALPALQERLFAQGTAGAPGRVLLVLQGMDTSGKGGVIDHVVGLLGPAGCHVASFKQPTPDERAHDFLWRIRRQVPGPGLIGVFDRSHYEDVLIVRVHGQIDDAQIARRYTEINAFETELAASGTRLVKCFLHVSFAEQRERLLARLDDPTKHWKFHESDIDERERWADYQAAYAAALERTSTDVAPWYVVPSDRKWYRNWAVSELLQETLEEIDPHYPDVSLDVPQLRNRLRPPY